MDIKGRVNGIYIEEILAFASNKVTEYHVPNVKVNLKLSGKGLATTATVSLSSVSEELMEEVLALFSKIEKEINK